MARLQAKKAQHLIMRIIWSMRAAQPRHLGDHISTRRIGNRRDASGGVDVGGRRGARVAVVPRARAPDVAEAGEGAQHGDGRRCEEFDVLSSVSPVPACRYLR